MMHEPIKEGFPDFDLEQSLEREELIDKELDKGNRTSFGLEEMSDRFGQHKLTERTAEMHRAVHALFVDGGIILDHILPEGRSKSTAFTKLQEALMWSNQAIAEMGPVIEHENEVPNM